MEPAAEQQTPEPVVRAQVFRAYPTAEQQRALLGYFDASRRLWNELVDYRKMLGRWHGTRWAARQRRGERKGDSYTGQLSRDVLSYWVRVAREIEPEQWAGLPAVILHGTVGEFAAAEKSYFELSKLWATPAGRRTLTGPPRRPDIRSPYTGPLTIRWQVKGRAGRAPTSKVLRQHSAGNVRWRSMNVPGIGQIRVRAHRDLPDDATIGQAVLAYDRMGAWRVTLQYQTTNPTTYEAPEGSVVGVDRGVAHTVVTSTGEAADVPAWTAREVERRNRLSQGMARSRRRNPCPADRWAGRKLIKGRCTCAADGGSCWKTSTRYEKRKTARAKLDRRRDRRVHDAVHKISARLAVTGETVVFEDLDISAMTRSARGTADAPGRNVKAKAGLNREIGARAWGSIAKQTEAKARHVERRRAAHTSQRCPQCGHVDAANRPRQATFRCVSCGFTAHADVVAGWNVAHWDRTDMTVRAAPSQDADTSGPSGQHVDDASRLPAQTTVDDRCERSGTPSERVTIATNAGQVALPPTSEPTALVPGSWGISTARNVTRKRRSRPRSRPSRRNGDPGG